MAPSEAPMAIRPLVQTTPPKMPKMNKLPPLNLQSVNAELDLKTGVGEPEESTSPRIKHSARSLGSKVMKGLTPRRSMLAILTPRSRSNQDSVLRASLLESKSAAELHQGPADEDMGPLESASREGSMRMSPALLEAELLLARSALLTTKKASEALLVQEIQTLRTSHASLDCELGTAKAIIAHAYAIEEDLRQALLAAEATGSATAQEARQLREQVQALEAVSGQLAANLVVRTAELTKLTEAAADKESQLLQGMQEVEGALHEVEHQQTEGDVCGQASSLQCQLGQDEEQRLAHPNGTTQTYAEPLANAMDSVERLQREIETCKGVSTQLTAQLQGAYAAAESSTKLLAQAHADFQLLTSTTEQLQESVKQRTAERDAVAAQLERLQVDEAQDAKDGTHHMPVTQSQVQHHGSYLLKKITTGIVLVGMGALAGKQSRKL